MCLDCALARLPCSPRLRDIKDRRLYQFQGMVAPPLLAPFVDGFVDARQIATHRTNVLRVVTSIRPGTATASVLLENCPDIRARKERRLPCTTLAGCRDPCSYWVGSAIQNYAAAPLLASTRERHAIRWLGPFFSNRLDELRDRSFENQPYLESTLNLIGAMIILQNIEYLATATDELKRHGHDVSPEIMRHI